MRELVPSDIITEKLSRDGNLKVTEIEVEDALESMLDTQTNNTFILTDMQDLSSLTFLQISLETRVPESLL